MEVIHQCSKCFWKLKCTLDIIIINHWTREVLEVRAFEPNIGKESEPVYLNRALLNAVIDKDDIVSRVKEIKEPLLRRREAVDDVLIEKKARNAAVSDIILNRLHVEKYSLESAELKISVVSTVCDVEKGRPDLTCACPPGLSFYVWDHAKKHLSSAEVESGLYNLNTEMESAHKQSAQAAKYEETARSVLTVKERWRLAIVFGKVARGRRLSAGDAKIWDAVAKNLENMADGSNKASSAMGHTPEYWERRIRSKRPTTPKRSSNNNSRSLTPRESVAKTITAQSGYTVLPASDNYTPGVGADGLVHSLEHSLGRVPGTSMNTANKCYRSAASIDLDDSAHSAPHGGMDSQFSFNRGISREHSGLADRHSDRRAHTPGRTLSPRQHSPRRSLEDISGGAGGAGDHSGHGFLASRSNSVCHSRPQSASVQHAHSKIHNAPINAKSSTDSADVTPKAKRKLLNPPKPETACDQANKQLLAARMLRSLAEARDVITASIRSSFSGKVKVYVDAAPPTVGDSGTQLTKPVKTPKSYNTVSTTSSTAASPSHSALTAGKLTDTTPGEKGGDSNDNSNANSFSVRKLLHKLTIGKKH